MLAGVLVLLPGLACVWLPDTFFFPVIGLNVLISSSLMFYMHYKRAAAIGLRFGWTLLLFINLICTAAFWSFISLLALGAANRGYC